VPKVLYCRCDRARAPPATARPRDRSAPRQPWYVAVATPARVSAMLRSYWRVIALIAIGSRHDADAGASRDDDRHSNRRLQAGAADMTRTLVAYALAAALLASSAHAQSLLPSQESRNFFGVRICRDRQILSAIKTLATNALKTKVIVAHGDGPNWSGYQPDDIRLEGVLADKSAVFCSVTISANETTERVVYVVGPDPDHSWSLKLGGDYGPGSGSHILFPRQWKITPAPPPTTLPVPSPSFR
jgi:hypothetical protein